MTIIDLSEQIDDICRRHPGTPTRPSRPGGLPTPPPRPENLLSNCTENCPLRPCEHPGGSESENRQQLGAQPTPRFRVMIEALHDALHDAVHDALLDAVIDPWPPFTFYCPQARIGRRSFD